jgi:hypothetical protein
MSSGKKIFCIFFAADAQLVFVYTLYGQFQPLALSILRLSRLFNECIRANGAYSARFFIRTEVVIPEKPLAQRILASQMVCLGKRSLPHTSNPLSLLQN